MGLFKAVLLFSAGLYAGIYVDQNYKIARVDDPQDLWTKVNDWLEQYKKPGS